MPSNDFADIPFWEAVGFEDHLDAWLAQESPPPHVAAVVVVWIIEQLDNPYRRVSRVLSIAPNLWRGRIPGTHYDDSDAFCAYWIFEETRQIRCDSIVTLGRPN